MKLIVRVLDVLVVPCWAGWWTSFLRLCRWWAWSRSANSTAVDQGPARLLSGEAGQESEAAFERMGAHARRLLEGRGARAPAQYFVSVDVVDHVDRVASAGERVAYVHVAHNPAQRPGFALR